MWMSDACAATPPSAVLPRSGLPEMHVLPHWGVCRTSGPQHSVLCVHQHVGCAHRCIPDVVDLSRHGCLLLAHMRCALHEPLPVARQLRMQCLLAGSEDQDAAVQAPPMHLGNATLHAAAS